MWRPAAALPLSDGGDMGNVTCCAMGLAPPRWTWPGLALPGLAWPDCTPHAVTTHSVQCAHAVPPPPSPVPQRVWPLCVQALEGHAHVVAQLSFYEVSAWLHG